MINNETMHSILAWRSYKVFDSRPIDDKALETIVMAGLYAPTVIHAVKCALYNGSNGG